MTFSAFNSNAYLHHVAFNTTRPLQLAKFYESALSIEKKRISGGWLLSGSNRRVLILSDKKNSLGFAGFACQDIHSFKNLKRVAKELGENMTDDEIQEMIDEADRDGDGEIGEEEFMRIMKKTNLF